MTATALRELLQHVVDYGLEAIDTVGNHTPDGILAERMREHSVLRTVQMVGEAAAQASKLDDRLLTRVPDLRRAIALRNVLVHGYVKIRMDEIVAIVRDDLPGLLAQVQALLGNDDL